MDLVSLLLRTATVQALKGATYAGARVFDSEIAPIDQKLEAERAPFVSVYTDEDEGQALHRDMLGRTRKLSLVIHFAVAGPVATGQGEDAIEIPHTDAAMELVLDVMGHDILAALQAGDGPWPGLWRWLISSLQRIVFRRGADSKKGLRFAARELVIECEPLAGPVPGVAWPVFAVAEPLLRANDDLAVIADIVAARVHDGPLDRAREAAILGLPAASWAALGRATLDDEAAPVARLSIEVEGRAGVQVNPEPAP